MSPVTTGFLDDWSGGDLTGTQASARSDALSDSRPSATSNHAITFTTNTNITGSSSIALAFPAGFSIPAALDCGDVDAATSSQFNFNWPGCVGTTTAWRYVEETVALLAARAPKLRRAVRDAKKAGYASVVLDGTLIPIDRVAADRPFYSGKHKKHGMNLQVIASPDGDIL